MTPLRPVIVSTVVQRFVVAAALLIAASTETIGAEILIADRANSRVVAFDAASGTFNRVVLEEPLFEPSAITMGPGGFAYVAHVDFNTGMGEILRVDPATGDFESWASELNFPGGLAYDPVSDSLFLSEFGQFDGEKILQLDSTGAVINTIGEGTGASGRTGLALDANGDLYAGAFATDGAFTGAVLKFDASDNFASLGVFATQLSTPGQQVPLNGTNGLAFDGEGNLYAAGLLSHRVIKFPSTGGTNTGEVFGTLIPSTSGLLFAEDGNLLASGLGNDNPNDPAFMNNLFPGGVMKLDIETAETIGGGPFIGTKILTLNDELGGDFDGNELVDGRDLDVLADSFGVDDGADTDGDGDTDGADFLNYQSAYGSLGAFQPTSMTLYDPAALSVATAVPEPATLALLTLATMAMMATTALRRLRRSSSVATG